MRTVVTGASGQLGAYLLEFLVEAGHDVSAWSGTSAGERAGISLLPIDLTDANTTERALAAADPEVILHAAAMSAADLVRRDPELAWRTNVEATAHLADWCRRRNRRMVFTSTDLVFDGTRGWYREDDPAEPVLEYGRTKRAAERAVVAAPRGLVARVSLMYGLSRCGRPAFFDRTLDALRQGHAQALFVDEFRTPLHLATAAAILTRLVAHDATGILHVGGSERVSRYELMRRSALALGMDTRLITGNRRSEVTLAEPRPADVSLDTTRLALLLPSVHRPTIEESLASSSPCRTGGGATGSERPG
jgi:dTDP-4-dehydrorhamnose reductase